MRRSLLHAGLLVGIVGFFGTFASPARADVQWSSRLGFGFGAAMGDLERAFVYENTIRVEALFGGRGDEHVRVGPAIDLRTRTFRSAEGSAGLGLLLPIARGYPIVLTATAGYAFRKNDVLAGWEDGPIFVGTAAWGYRSYDFHDHYQIGFHVFVSTRVHLDQVSRWELTAGIELDLEMLFVVPARFFVSLFRRGPPDEPDE
ncbi:MAG: hypothetical protein H6721_20010 [Sandaracinus sp.]|nr:hypothetical protein [Sandaracinus sp.]MCB9634414.1 hypothetical protein [Sandaracinus sp.]